MQTAYELAKKNYGRTWTIEMLQALVDKGKLSVDEYVEITPKSMRMRKILLTESERKKMANKAIAHIKM